MTHLELQKRLNQTDNDVGYKMPAKYYSSNSLLSAIKQIYYKNERQAPTSTIPYDPPLLPDSPSFTGNFTDVDLDYGLWFVLVNDKTRRRSQQIHRTIFNQLRKLDQFSSFSGKAEHGRALTAYDTQTKQWIRGELIFCIDGQYNIRSVDTGRVIKVLFEHLSNDVFCTSIPKLAIKASLSNCVPFEEKKNIRKVMKELLVGKKCKIIWEVRNDSLFLFWYLNWFTFSCVVSRISNQRMI